MHAEFIKNKLEDKVAILGHKDDLLKIEVTIDGNVDLLVLFFAGVDCGIKQAAEILK
mgnify:CR=1 FL=1